MQKSFFQCVHWMIWFICLFFFAAFLFSCFGFLFYNACFICIKGDKSSDKSGEEKKEPDTQQPKPDKGERKVPEKL